MVAIYTMYVLDMSVNEIARIQVLYPTWVRNRLRRYAEEGLRNLLRCGRPRKIPCSVMNNMIVSVVGCRITPVEMQWHFGKTSAISDLAPQYHSRSVGGFFCKNKNVKIMCFTVEPFPLVVVIAVFSACKVDVPDVVCIFTKDLFG